jgi:hypothetical protein
MVVHKHAQLIKASCYQSNLILEYWEYLYDWGHSFLISEITYLNSRGWTNFSIAQF